VATQIAQSADASRICTVACTSFWCAADTESGAESQIRFTYPQ
jgi:hypothetical protein